jgi:anti-sigma factor RsiW
MTAAMDEDSRLLLHAYVDGELDPAHALEVERQLSADAGLAAERDRIEALRRLIQERLPRETAPPGLAARVEAAIGRAPPSQLGPSGKRLSSFGSSWRALAASFVTAAFLASGTTWLVLRPNLSEPSLSPAQEMADMVVASHIRSLMAPQPADVASSDRHTVKPWFNGKVIEAPRVVDLGNEGFPLVGGRIDVIGRVPVPALVYRHRQHVISLLAVPAGDVRGAVPERRAIAGYNILTWTQNGVVYWAVSDVAAADLEKFATAFRNAPA